MPCNVLRKKMGVIGIRLQRELKGEQHLNLSTKSSPKQETCVSKSFAHPVTRKEELRQAISTYVVRASEKLRQQKQLAGSITVFTRTSPFIPSFLSSLDLWPVL